MNKQTLINILSILISNNASTPLEARKVIDNYFKEYKPKNITKKEIKQYFKL